ncbi:alcohol dehydrogenase catalytic domain-containing protein [Sodalis praecaptivus]|nr:alcohol dehydrogenase catalytic domain-containing protein [Sodalis praecaptivus]
MMPGPGEVLAKVEAFSICASDVKMIDMGNDYPLFKDRDFAQHPAILGHELSLTVAAAGAGMAEAWPIGRRFGVQPDVYLNHQRYCIGVNVTGGMAEYLLLGKEVFQSDHGSCAFPVDEEISHAALAQTEPLACVEAAFVQHSRKHMKPGGRLLIYLDDKVQQRVNLDIPLVAAEITRVGSEARFAQYVNGAALHGNEILATLPEREFDDVLILGNPDVETLTQLTERMAVNGLLCWLPDTRPDPMAPVDIAKIHYHNVNILGSPQRRLSAAFTERTYRYDYQPGGTLVLSGGGGTMGRMHLLRALKSVRPPAKIIVTGKTSHRLKQMQKDIEPLLIAATSEVYFVAVQEHANFRQTMRDLVGPDGASDIIISAPGIDPITGVVDVLAKDGTLVLFSGTRYGQFGPLPLGQVAWTGATITASSGSCAADQRRVLDKIQRGEALPDFNVAAVGGLLATLEGLKAVKAGRFPGKVVIYPHLTALPLLPINRLGEWDDALGEWVSRHGWSKQAEKLLFSQYNKKIS